MGKYLVNGTDIVEAEGELEIIKARKIRYNEWYYSNHTRAYVEVRLDSRNRPTTKTLITIKKLKS